MNGNTYKYNEIVSMTKSEILFNDGHLINFTECASRWAEKKGISLRNYTCVGDRNFSEDVPYFDLYSKPVTRIVFPKKTFLGKKKSRKEFELLRSKIGNLGWTLRDISYER
ncbi:MAG: hypothetical protein IJM37_11235 [Lachnospiraceae bacterium]|nr:hypothetical protein [Lachnospiraceae bacterium]